MRLPSRSQLTEGLGLPKAVQVKVMLPPSLASTYWGGVSVNVGGAEGSEEGEKKKKQGQVKYASKGRSTDIWSLLHLTQYEVLHTVSRIKQHSLDNSWATFTLWETKQQPYEFKTFWDFLVLVHFYCEALTAIRVSSEWAVSEQSILKLWTHRWRQTALLAYCCVFPEIK